MNRRQFLQTVGVSIIALEIPLKARADWGQISEDDQPAYPPSLEDNYLKINSGEGFIPHRHDLLIPLSVLENPPEQGVELRTTKTAFHTHAVELSQIQLQQIRDGQQVIVEDATVGEHVFIIYLPQAE